MRLVIIKWLEEISSRPNITDHLLAWLFSHHECPLPFKPRLQPHNFIEELYRYIQESRSAYLQAVQQLERMVSQAKDYDANFPVLPSSTANALQKSNEPRESLTMQEKRQLEDLSRVYRQCLMRGCLNKTISELCLNVQLLCQPIPSRASSNARPAASLAAACLLEQHMLAFLSDVLEQSIPIIALFGKPLCDFLSAHLSLSSECRAAFQHVSKRLDLGCRESGLNIEQDFKVSNSTANPGKDSINQVHSNREKAFDQFRALMNDWQTGTIQSWTLGQPRHIKPSFGAGKSKETVIPSMRGRVSSFMEEVLPANLRWLSWIFLGECLRSARTQTFGDQTLQKAIGLRQRLTDLPHPSFLLLHTYEIFFAEFILAADQHSLNEFLLEELHHQIHLLEKEWRDGGAAESSNATVARMLRTAGKMMALVHFSPNWALSNGSLGASEANTPLTPAALIQVQPVWESALAAGHPLPTMCWLSAYFSMLKGDFLSQAIPVCANNLSFLWSQYHSPDVPKTGRFLLMLMLEHIFEQLDRREMDSLSAVTRELEFPLPSKSDLVAAGTEEKPILLSAGFHVLTICSSTVAATLSMLDRAPAQTVVGGRPTASATGNRSVHRSAVTRVRVEEKEPNLPPLAVEFFKKNVELGNVVEFTSKRAANVASEGAVTSFLALSQTQETIATLIQQHDNNCMEYLLNEDFVNQATQNAFFIAEKMACDIIRQLAPLNSQVVDTALRIAGDFTKVLCQHRVRQRFESHFQTALSKLQKQNQKNLAVQDQFVPATEADALDFCLKYCVFELPPESFEKTLRTALQRLVNRIRVLVRQTDLIKMMNKCTQLMLRFGAMGESALTWSESLTTSGRFRHILQDLSSLDQLLLELIHVLLDMILDMRLRWSKDSSAASLNVIGKSDLSQICRFYNDLDQLLGPVYLKSSSRLCGLVNYVLLLFLFEGIFLHHVVEQSSLVVVGQYATRSSPPRSSNTCDPVQSFLSFIQLYHRLGPCYDRGYSPLRFTALLSAVMQLVPESVTVESPTAQILFTNRP